MSETLLQKCDERLRELFLRRAKDQGWTGWEEKTLKDVAHIRIQDLELIAALEVIENELSWLRSEINEVARRAVYEP